MAWRLRDRRQCALLSQHPAGRAHRVRRGGLPGPARARGRVHRGECRLRPPGWPAPAPRAHAAHRRRSAQRPNRHAAGREPSAPPRRLRLETRQQSPADFGYTVATLRRACQAAVATGSPVMSCRTRGWCTWPCRALPGRQARATPPGRTRVSDANHQDRVNGTRGPCSSRHYYSRPRIGYPLRSTAQAAAHMKPSLCYRPAIAVATCSPGLGWNLIRQNEGI